MELAVLSIRRRTNKMEQTEIDSEIADILLKSGKVEEKKAENGNR